MSNRRNRRQKTKSPFSVSMYPSNRSIIPANEKRKNVSVNTICTKQKKSERGK